MQTATVSQVQTCRVVARVALLVGVALSAAGCRTRLLDADPSGASGGDLAVSAADGGVCGAPAWRLVPVPLDAFASLPANARTGSALYAEVLYPRSKCEIRGPIDVRLDFATARITVTAYVWSTGASCEIVQEHRYVILSDDGKLPVGRVVLRDGAPGGKAGAEIVVRQAAPSTCLPSSGACGDNCECMAADPSSRCVDGFCGWLCRADRDCPDARPWCNDSFCTRTGGSCADFMQLCPAGTSCSVIQFSFTCRPSQTGIPGASCSRDEDCGAGGVCSDCACLLLCATDPDCPLGMSCDRTRGCVTLP